jgi:rubrerythrin
MSIQSEAAREFDAYYIKTMTAEHLSDEQERPESLRVSSFPFCALRMIWNRMTAHTRVRKMKYGQKFHTGVGTITHAVIQAWAGRGGQVWGAWKCNVRRCGGIREFSRNPKCPKCDAQMEYVEITVTAFKNVSGHID